VIGVSPGRCDHR